MIGLSAWFSPPSHPWLLEDGYRDNPPPNDAVPKNPRSRALDPVPMALLRTRRGRTTNKARLHSALGAPMTRDLSPPASGRPTRERAGAADPFPKLLLDHARLRPDRPANREKDYGIW